MPSTPATSRVTTPNLAPVSVLRRGDSGGQVAQLQRLLNANGASLEVDGRFMSRTEAAVRVFQRDHGLRVDGKVGSQTWAVLRATSPSSIVDTTPPPSVRATFDEYAALVRAAGGVVNPNGQPTVLGIRQGAARAQRSYTDRFIVLLPNGTVREFKGSTTPGQSSSSLATDANRDGAGDVAIIRPGNYQASAHGIHNGLPSFTVSTLDGNVNIPAWRDTNHDGVYSEAETSASERRGDRADGILLHAGFDSRPKSIGCQTMSPNDMRAFIDLVGGPTAKFNYTLVNG